MVFLNQNNRYKFSQNFCHTLSRLLVCVLLLLVFFGGSIKANIPNAQYLNLTNKTVVPTVNKADVSANSSDPIQLPDESSLLFAELDDQADDDKKIAIAFFAIQFYSIKQATEIKSVQSFHYKQAIQQILPIPLFVLHHSWKSYLV